jgi:hypothetical protein
MQMPYSLPVAIQAALAVQVASQDSFVQVGMFSAATNT